MHFMYDGGESYLFIDTNFNVLYGMDYYFSSVLHKKKMYFLGIH